MKRFLTNAALWASIVLAALAVVPLGLAIAPAAGASTAWTGSTSITSPFYTAWQHHQGCGKHTSGVRRGYYGNYRQTFAHCSMTFSTVFVTHFRTPTATPRPTHTPLPPVLPPPATAIPTAIPRATDTSTLAPTPIPTATATAPPVIVPPPGDAVSFEFSLMDTTRAQYGLPPYSINSTESNGTATCVGSYGHSVHMSQTGILAHDQFPADICIPFRSAGENIGYAGGFSVTGALQTIHDQMMAEEHDAAFCAQFSNHACSIISPAFTQVGIGVYTANGITWLTVDFLQ